LERDANHAASSYFAQNHGPDNDDYPEVDKSLYHDSLAMSPLEVELKLALAKGMLMLWSDLCFDMGVSQHLNVASQNELETLLRELDTKERNRFGMAPPVT
jgi:hypothetical protein